MLKFQKLHIGFDKSKRRKQRTLFSVENMTFQEGEFVAVIGPNGSGKTTLFNTMLGHQNALSGAINIKNENWGSLNKLDKAKHLSFVPSKFEGVNHLNVYDLISMGRAPYTNMLNKLTHRDELVVEKVIQQLGLSNLADKNTVNLSDGERQTAMIGKALAQESKIMILDEPTAFLDYNNRRKVLELLREIAISSGQLIFISSHDLDLCFEYCTRIIAIDVRSNSLLNFNKPFNNQGIIEKVFDNSKD